MSFPWHHFGCICFSVWFVYSFMGASPQTKLADLKIFTHPQVTGSSGCFFSCGGQVRMGHFSKGSVLLFGCVCILLAIVSLWPLGITHFFGSLRWLAQRNQRIVVACCFWLRRCRSKLLLTNTKIVENLCDSVWNLFFSKFLVEGTQTILKSDMLTSFCYSTRFFT